MLKWTKVLVIALFAFSIATASNIKNSDLLISAEEAIKLIGKPGVMFVSGDDDTAYKGGHIKGSVEMYAHHLHHADITGHMHCAPLFMCPKEAEEFIGKHGISNDTLIIAYDNFRGPNATGVYAFFRSWGHTNIKVLDGGRDAIKAIDPEQKVYDKIKEDRKALKDEIKNAKKAKDDAKVKELTAKDKELGEQLKAQSEKLLVLMGDRREPVKKAEYKIDTSKIDYNYIAHKDELLKASNDILANGDKSKYVIIDSRGITEIMGEKKMDNVARGGHIPGARFIEWKNITDFDKQLSFKKLDDLKKVFDEAGIKKDQTIYAYCHVGAGRSTHIIMALQLLGYKNVKVYTGSWDEWGNDMNLPISR